MDDEKCVEIHGKTGNLSPAIEVTPSDIFEIQERERGQHSIAIMAARHAALRVGAVGAAQGAAPALCQVIRKAASILGACWGPARAPVVDLDCQRIHEDADRWAL